MVRSRPGTRRTARVAAVAAMAGALCLLGPGAAHAANTTTPGSLATGGSLSPVATAGTLSTTSGTLAVPVPDGTRVTAVTGVLSAPTAVTGATVVVLLGGREALRVPATLYRRITVPVETGDVRADGTLDVALRYDAPSGAAGCTTPDPVSLRKLGLTYSGSETPPATIADFFPPSSSQLDVRIAADAGDDVYAAALQAVAALTRRYDGATPVVLATDDTALDNTGAGHRVVRIVGSDAAADESGSGSATATLGTTIRVPTLTLTGSGLDLSAAARALADDDEPLADGGVDGGGDGTDDGLLDGDLEPATTERAGGPTRTLAELHADAPVPPSPPGAAEVELRQDSFGGPVTAYDVHLRGTHSALPAGVTARLDVLLDDTLLASTTLDGDSGGTGAVDLDAHVPGGLLHTSDRLRVAVAYAGGDPSACDTALPVQLSLDETASTVTATRGTGDLTGFQRLPQALDGRLQVALRSVGERRLDDVLQAAPLVSALQQQAAGVLTVSLVDPDVLLAATGDAAAGLLVGADPDDSAAIDTPLRLSGDRSLDAAGTDFTLDRTAPFAALQVVAARDTLVLGSWSPGGLTADPALSERLTRAVTTLGWGALEGDVLVYDGTSAPYVVDSGVVVDTEVPTLPTTSYLGWFAAAIGLLLALLAVQLVRAVRRDRRAARAGLSPGPPPRP